MTRRATAAERGDHDRDLRKHEPRVSDLSKSLASYVSADDLDLTRKEFLFTVATRILDDLSIPHELSSIVPNGYLKG